MSKKDWIKIVILLLIPINTWLFILYRLQYSKMIIFYPSFEQYEFDSKILINYFREKWRIKEGERIQFPFLMKEEIFMLGKSPPLEQGVPVLFLNIGWIAYPEVWEPTIHEVLKKPSLHLVLLYNLRSTSGSDRSQKEIQKELNLLEKMLEQFSSPRISAIAGERLSMAFGLEIGGILAILCNGQGIVEAVEFYPPLNRSPRWSDEVADWRPKLHQAVKRVLDKFFPKEQGR